MRQYISSQQFNELSEKGKERYYEWVFKTTHREMVNNVRFTFGDIIKREGLPQVNIGQMIEFLDEQRISKERVCTKTLDMCLDYGEFAETKNKWSIYTCCETINDKELCDCLWEAVKRILDKS